MPTDPALFGCKALTVFIASTVNYDESNQGRTVVAVFVFAWLITDNVKS